MVSFLISSKDKNKLQEQWQKICAKEKISKFDITVVEPEKGIGIKDVREAQARLYLKPFQGEKKAVIINAFLGITVEAQNALLKSLEEPPDNTIIILAISDLKSILQTIISRCKVIDLDQAIRFSEEEKEKYLKLFEKMQKATTGEKLKLAQDFSKTKEDGIEFTQNLILALRNLIINQEGERNKLLNTLRLFQEANKTLKTTNANPRLALENLLLSI